MKKEREATLEKKLVREVTKIGGLCLKLYADSWQGIPDRMCLFPDGRIIFVEMKSTGEKARKIQLLRHRELQRRNFIVLVIDSSEQIKEFIRDQSEKINQWKTQKDT